MLPPSPPLTFRPNRTNSILPTRIQSRLPPRLSSQPQLRQTRIIKQSSFPTRHLILQASTIRLTSHLHIILLQDRRADDIRHDLRSVEDVTQDDFIMSAAAFACGVGSDFEFYVAYPEDWHVAYCVRFKFCEGGEPVAVFGYVDVGVGGEDPVLVVRSSFWWHLDGVWLERTIVDCKDVAAAVFAGGVAVWAPFRINLDRVVTLREVSFVREIFVSLSAAIGTLR